MRRTIEILALIAVSGMVAPVAAQERTPEGAIQFLQTALLGVEMNNFEGNHGRYREFVKPGGRFCTLKARFDYLDDTGKPTGASGWMDQYFEDTLEVKLLGDEVRDTRKIGDKVETFAYSIGSKAMAERVFTAMEFLRKHCDKTAGTGF